MILNTFTTIFYPFSRTAPNVAATEFRARVSASPVVSFVEKTTPLFTPRVSTGTQLIVQTKAKSMFTCRKLTTPTITVQITGGFN